jgi:quercetin dioxygenase-like cupin family protein
MQQAQQTTSEPIELGGMTIQFLLESDQTHGSVSIFRCDLPVGSRIPAPHSHDGFDETVYGLSGILTFTLDGVPARLGPGEIIFVPRGVVHGFSVNGDEDVSILCVSTPGLFGPGYFRDLAAVMTSANGSPPDRGAIFAVMQRHGLTPAVPAPAD